ncbi:hypothetical protein EGW08_003439 [Elysia chlorotica]|uniref:Receptor L-domain domain-containing protein n=1 Tax=Elysia chlorotica TaxID=188477 RepID=A0A3S1CCC3_ELYCH|nr:hypothetical protein EGW08_003439 [Elysia chlorotica]
MARFTVLLLSVGWISSLFAPSASASCPFMCTCSGDTAQCGGISSLTGLVLPESIRRVIISGGALPLIKPGAFGNKTEHVQFNGCKIGDIQPHAFSNLQNLKTLEFHGSSIDRILPCGIHAISNAESIGFFGSGIREIQAGGISDIASLGNLTVSSSIITTVGSFGFDFVQTEILAITYCSVDFIKTAAFSNIYDVKSFILSGISSKSIEAGAFYRVKNFESVVINGNFRGLQHNTLMELREATPGNHNGFQFENSIIACDCHSAPLLDYVQNNPTSIDGQVLCSITSRPIQNVKIQEICPGYRRETYCTQVTLTPPTCSSVVGNTSSLAAYEETICPTKPRRVDLGANGRQEQSDPNRGSGPLMARGVLIALLTVCANTASSNLL